MEFINLDKIKFNKIFNLKVDDNTRIYSLKDKNIVGYGLLTDTKTNPINIHIIEKYRSNRYGSYLYKELINILKKEKKYKEIYLSISKNNTNIKNIIKNNGGIEVSEEKDCIFYIIPLNK